MTTAWIVLLTFWGLVLLLVARREHRAALLARTARDWVLDVAGLLIQGIVIPLAQVGVVVALMTLIVPSAQGTWALPLWAAFLFNVIAIDYLYYWNHRALHTAWLWPLHRIHHTLDVLDVLGTGRNTVYTSFFIVYLWSGGVMLYLLENPIGFALGAALTAALDLWRHSPFGPARGSALERVLGAIFVLPKDHAWHHSRDEAGVNYGANFSLWDRLHGTYRASEAAPKTLGIPFAGGLGRALFYPVASAPSLPAKRPREGTSEAKT